MTDDTHSLRGAAPAEGALHQETRRDFLQLVAGAVGAVAVVATGYVLVDMLNPAADVLAAGGPVDIDLTKVAPGQQVIVQWRGKPIFIVNRTPPLLKELQDPTLVNRLADPTSDTNQQPPYARNWHRSIKPEYAVLVGICTHLGCIPGYFPKPDREQSGAQLARRLFLPLPRLEIRFGRARLCRGAGAV